MTQHDSLKEIKHLFMAYRNGVVADALRKGGVPHEIIFGLQIPQINEIAGSIPATRELAEALWKDVKVRESRLLACWIFPGDALDFRQAFDMASSVASREEADILCFKLLRRLPFASELAVRLSESGQSLTAYCGEALQRNLQ